MSENGTCLGCLLANRKQPVHVVYEDDDVCCFLDHEPFNEGHTLILPKKHFLDVDELDQDTAIAVMKASMTTSKALKTLFQPDGVTICQNGGRFNELGHYHMHVVARYEDQPFEAFYSTKHLNNDKEKWRFLETKARLAAEINTMT
ncbi:diadenosine tetraphosphate (Ap4A) HIT family hydrolase [Scopulibacillus darangshiensis]|uniref:Diadenosine tetraphosphate (Ap4A) HIT family hydrolase n=1 Tax=Scopulibacillus darangshiensis TaxID=442528 RepID=A0A4R2P4H8_9BACL|nr:HIT family protein [Scopulibacillus darangshiensis]TCP29720.1 diadenosine tetraphosphate (Ap4A) HIT family hydrolase [Scopulibacillus darangshiensis]